MPSFIKNNLLKNEGGWWLVIVK